MAPFRVFLSAATQPLRLPAAACICTCRTRTGSLGCAAHAPNGCRGLRCHRFCGLSHCTTSHAQLRTQDTARTVPTPVLLTAGSLPPFCAVTPRSRPPPNAAVPFSSHGFSLPFRHAAPFATLLFLVAYRLHSSFPQFLVLHVAAHRACNLLNPPPMCGRFPTALPRRCACWTPPAGCRPAPAPAQQRFPGL